MTTHPLSKDDHYDFSLLPKGFLYNFYNSGFRKKYTITAVGMYGALLGLMLESESWRHINSFFDILPLTIFFMIVILVVIHVALPWISQDTYEKQKKANKFVKAYGLKRLSSEQITGTIPPSLSVEGMHEIRAYGYELKIGDQTLRVFDYAYAIGRGKSRRDFYFAIAALPLERDYPHIYLDGKANGRNRGYNHAQRVDLEGNFSKYFELYVPNKAEVGALTILSPDTMQTLIELAQPYDVEIQNNAACVITRGFAYTRNNLPALLVASEALLKEFNMLGKSWKPVYTVARRPFRLQRNSANWLLLLALITAVVVSLLTVLILFFLKDK